MGKLLLQNAEVEHSGPDQNNHKLLIFVISQS